MLIPLAAADDQRWRPLTGEVRKLPRDGWRYYPAAGESRPLIIRGVAETSSHCSAIDAFRTDVQPRRVAGTEWPLDKLGLAVRGGIQGVERVEDVRVQPDDASRALARIIVQLVHAFDVETDGYGDVQRPAARERARVPVVLTTFVRDAEERYYFEARKRYGATGYDIVSSGWIASAGSRYSMFDVESTLTDPDYKNVRRQRALAIVVVGGRRVWVMQVNGYEAESYRIYDRSLDRPAVMEVDEGGC